MTYTVILDSYTFLKNGTWNQVKEILNEGYCVARKNFTEDGNCIIFLGLLIR